MVYKYISTNNIISKVKRDYNINYTDWVYLSVEWIAECLSQLDIKIHLQLAKEEITVNNYRCNLPCDLELLLGIEYNGQRLHRNNIVSRQNRNRNTNISLITDDVFEDNELILERYNTILLDDNNSYMITGNNVLEFSFETGDIIVYYKTLPTELDTAYNIKFPLIPDNANLIECISWYIMCKILSRGHIHPVFTYKDALAMYDKYVGKAKSSLNRLDSDEKECHSRLWQSFINVNYYNNAKFK